MIYNFIDLLYLQIFMLGGGIKIKHDVKMCEIFCDDKIFELKGVIDGHIIEINEAILNNPQLLAQEVNSGKIKYILFLKSESLGYVALVNVGLKGAENKVKHLLNEENYHLALKNKITN